VHVHGSGGREGGTRAAAPGPPKPTRPRMSHRQGSHPRAYAWGESPQPLHHPHTLGPKKRRVVALPVRAVSYLGALGTNFRVFGSESAGSVCPRAKRQASSINKGAERGFSNSFAADTMRLTVDGWKLRLLASRSFQQGKITSRKKKKKDAALGVPGWSPTPVLAEPGRA
jgi:hypothetical protein